MCCKFDDEKLKRTKLQQNQDVMLGLRELRRQREKRRGFSHLTEHWPGVPSGTNQSPVLQSTQNMRRHTHTHTEEKVSYSSSYERTAARTQPDTKEYYEVVPLINLAYTQCSLELPRSCK